MVADETRGGRRKILRNSGAGEQNQENGVEKDVSHGHRILG